LGHGGAKSPPEKRQREDWELKLAAEHAGDRARRNMGWKLRMLGGPSVLWTLTKRGRIESREEAWRLWGEMERICSRRFAGVKFVTVIEPHTLDGYHIHFAASRFLMATTMRLLWHRILTGEKLRGVLMGSESPGNVDAKYQVRSTKRLCSYMAKYLGKTFDVELGKRFKRYAASKGIAEPTRVRSWLPTLLGGHQDLVQWLRARVERDGYVVSRMYETVVVGRRMLWIEATLKKGSG
jgi:hypothetical protein